LIAAQQKIRRMIISPDFNLQAKRPTDDSLASCGFLESPFAPRKQRIRNFRGAKGDTYFPLDAYLLGAVQSP